MDSNGSGNSGGTHKRNNQGNDKKGNKTTLEMAL